MWGGMTMISRGASHGWFQFRSKPSISTSDSCSSQVDGSRSLACLAMICAAGVLALGGCAEDPFAVPPGCCQVGADSCADGAAVTEVYCESELGGTWQDGTRCSLITGACE